ncbi:Uncharacterised protein [Budvicia aquatica]|uniref:Adhesin n=2 Tax=Budvicia aquatica TaxID=82979 RepID=A0A2C6DFJ6_9GAMM|nr:hypothetical protein CRN84_06865 [Budvicia aquatica]VFS47215.1 Uncharacterised protein [Budvicia aquatica]
MHLTSSVTKHSTEYYRMKTSTINGQDARSGGLYRKGYLYLLALLTLLAGMAQSVKAENITITIGKGSGVIWEGMPFSEKMTGPMGNSYLYPNNGMLSISYFISTCGYPSGLENIAGYMSRKITQGVGLIPRATATATYLLYDNKTTETLSGTIGLPKTEGKTSGSTANVTVTSPTGYVWCLPPRMTEDSQFFRYSGNRTVSVSGTWVLVADGTQVNSEARLHPMYFGSYSTSGSGNLIVRILPSDITLRISTLECTVSTPTMINFGNVQHSTQPRTELAIYPTSSIVTSCSQDVNYINANINLQFRAATGLFGGESTQLSLAQGGGYITGEIDGVTGSGECDANTGIPFDNTQLKIGNILSTESTKVISNKVIWRLCSGGSALPVGNVSASAEMLVTFN